jgi:hypothetical protein
MNIPFGEGIMWQMELVGALKVAGCNERSEIFARYEERTGLTRRTLYRVAERFGYKSERQQREDKGVLKSGITDDQIKYVAGLIYVTGRENKGPIMPIDEALSIAIDNGIIEPGQVTASTLARLLREHQLSKDAMKAPTPHTEMRSLHPNHVHLVDVSVCIQYYLKNGKLGIMDERDFYKNKPDSFAKIKQKLLRYVLEDHFSGLFIWRYYIADGESRENLWDFLKWAWGIKSTANFPFHGVPFILLMDAGSAQRSHAMQNFFKGLQITIPKGKPYNPRRQGGVEGSHNPIEVRFETRLRLCPAYSVEELNAWSIDYAIWHHASREHTRHGETRLASWLRIKPEQLRLLPGDDILNLIYAEPEKECTVRNYQFSYRGETFRVKDLPGMHHNAKVMVSINPYRWKEELVATVIWQNTPYEVQAVKQLPASLGGFSEHAAIIGQEYKAQPETPVQKTIKEITQMAYGNREPKKGDIPFEGTTVFGIHAEKVGNLTSLPKRGTAIEVARPAEPVQQPIMQLFKRLRDAGVKVTPTLNQQLRTEFGATIDAGRLEEVVRHMVDRGDWRAEAPIRAAQ